MAKPKSSADIQVGHTYRLYYHSGNLNNKTIHIRAIVDREWFVYRTYGRKGWIYLVDHAYSFDLWCEFGHLTEIKKRKYNG